MKRLPLRVWGALCIFGGIAARLIGPAPKNREELLGKSVAALFFLVVGLVLIAKDLVHSRRK